MKIALMIQMQLTVKYIYFLIHFLFILRQFGYVTQQCKKDF